MFRQAAVPLEDLESVPLLVLTQQEPAAALVCGAANLTAVNAGRFHGAPSFTSNSDAGAYRADSCNTGAGDLAARERGAAGLMLAGVIPGLRRSPLPGAGSGASSSSPFPGLSARDCRAARLRMSSVEPCT